jgi:hypothetical protein
VTEALLIIWRRRAKLLRALISAGLALAALDTAETYLTAEQSSWLLRASFAAAIAVVFTMFAVTCHRIVLLNETKVPRYGIYPWTPREMRFFGWTIVGYIYFFIITMLFVLLSGLVSAATGTLQSLSVILYLALLPGTYVFARFSVLLPATAVDEHRDLKWAWDITSGNGWRLVVIVVLLPLLSGAVVGFFEVERYPIVEFLINLLSYALVAIEIATLSVSFRFLAEKFSVDEANPASKRDALKRAP